MCQAGDSTPKELARYFHLDDADCAVIVEKRGEHNRLVASREFLYHLPCSSSARKLDGFGSGWLAPETAVRPDRV